MWVFMNDSFISMVEHNEYPKILLVRARKKEDLVSLFPGEEIFEDDGTDYKFRMFLSKRQVADIVKQKIINIDYGNFKDSVKDLERKRAYMRIWDVMFDFQEKIYGKAHEWWLNYRRQE